MFVLYRLVMKSQVFSIKIQAIVVCTLGGFDLCTFRLYFSANSSTASATFTCTIVSGSDGTYKLTLTDTVTAALDDGRYLYDVELILADSTIEKVHHGIVTVHPEATKI